MTELNRKNAAKFDKSIAEVKIPCVEISKPSENNNDGQQQEQEERKALSSAKSLEEFSNDNAAQNVKYLKKKSRKKGFFISYSSTAPYKEKKFVLELVKQLGEIGMQDDIWLDKDVLQKEWNSPFFISSRLDAAEKCKAAILVLSSSYFTDYQTRCEAELLLSRVNNDSFNNDAINYGPELFIVKFSSFYDAASEGCFETLLDNISVDLSHGKISRLSEAEKVSMFIEILSKRLEELCNGFSIKVPKISEDVNSSSQFKLKPIVSWTVKDVQDWLVFLRIHEKYIISFEEFEINGYLLQALTESVLSNVLAVDSQICRRKILQRVKAVCDEELRTGRFCEWSKYKAVRSKPNGVYLIQDPSDEELGQILKQDLKRKGAKVFSHGILGQSKEEFLRSNAQSLASCYHCIILLTEKSAESPFVFFEAVLSEWLSKPVIIAVFQKSSSNTRLALSALLSSKPAINFETSLYLDGLELLWDEIKPVRAVSAGVVFEQRYLRQVAEGVRPFNETIKQIGASRCTPENRLSAISDISSKSSNAQQQQQQPKIFLSYHWDHQSKVRSLIKNLNSARFSCWSDMEHVTKRPVTQQSIARMTPGLTSRMTPYENLASEIENNIRSSKAVVLCVTPRYLQSSDFLKEVGLASTYDRPLVAVMLQWVAWPPDGVPGSIKRVFASIRCIDLSNEKLLARNMPLLISHLLQISAGK